jgi:hexosaminidase
VLNLDESTFRFAEDVVASLADTFTSREIHIGGDECPTVEWESSDRGRALMAEHGYSGPRQLQGLYTRRLADTLRTLGRRAVAWDEALDTDAPSDLFVMAWRHVERARLAAEAGHDVVVAAMEHLYFDWPNSESRGEPLSLLPPPFATPWEKVYRFEVVPRRLDPSLTGRILGAQAQLWTEYVATESHLHYMAFPRLCALSEVLWGTTESEELFRERLSRHLMRLRGLGVAYRPLDGV